MTENPKHDWTEKPEGANQVILTCSKCGMTVRTAPGEDAAKMADEVAPECTV